MVEHRNTKVTFQMIAIYKDPIFYRDKKLNSLFVPTLKDLVIKIILFTVVFLVSHVCVAVMAINRCPNIYPTMKILKLTYQGEHCCCCNDQFGGIKCFALYYYLNSFVLFQFTLYQ